MTMPTTPELSQIESVRAVVAVRFALYKGTSAMSKAIRWLNWSEYSHAALICRDGKVIEAWTQGGVRQVESLSDRHNPGTPVDVFCVPALTNDEAMDVETFCRSQIGKRYDWRGVFHFITRRPERPDDQEAWFCSELLAAAFAYARRPLLARIQAWKVYPGMLAHSTDAVFEGTVITK